MNYILFHVPHSSLKIPKKYWDICIKDKNYIEKTNKFLCDYLTDKLIPNGCKKIVFNYSRLFCDVEKFKDDKKEIMSKKGMGVIYTNDCDCIIAVPNKKYRRKILKIYDKYHNKLDKKVTNILRKYNKCIIVDFHSFSNEMVEKLFSIKDFPDICIGTNDYTDEKLINITIEHFKEYGYSVMLNSPYSGSIIPNKFINKSNRISSIMLEINKNLYLNNNFYEFKQCIDDYYKKIKDLL